MKQIFLLFSAILIGGFFIIANNTPSPAVANEQNKPIKIYWKNKDITAIVYPTVAKGNVYVMDYNFINVVKGTYYQTISSLFMKNDQNKWQQKALRFGVKNPAKHEHILEVKVYTNTNKMSINDLNGLRQFTLKFPTLKAKKKSGSLLYIYAEAKWVTSGSGTLYVADLVLKRVQGEYVLHYVSLEDLCTVFKLKLLFDAKANTYRIQ